MTGAERGAPAGPRRGAGGRLPEDAGSPLPLEGITVVALEQAVAAPFATRQLADQGARVIKVERVDGGDFARAYDSAVRGGLGTHFAWLNRSKESVALDLKRDEGRAILADLVARADVFLQNLAPGAAARLGFGADALRARDPRLIVVDMSGYGTSGPYRDKRAYDMLVQAEAGLISVTGTPETPVKAGSPLADIAAGMYAFSGVLAALVRRGGTGEGASIEVSMFDAVAEWMTQAMYTTLFTGSPPPRTRLSHPVIAPYDAYPTADGADVVIGVQNDRGWAALAAGVLDRPDLVTDPEFATNRARPGEGRRDRGRRDVRDGPRRAAEAARRRGRRQRLPERRARPDRPPAAGRAGPLARGRLPGRRHPGAPPADHVRRHRGPHGPDPGPRRAHRRRPARTRPRRRGDRRAPRRGRGRLIPVA